MSSNISLKPRISVNIITATRAKDAASGNVAYTGMGFRPSVVLCAVDDGAAAGSIGFGNVANREAFVRLENSTTFIDNLIAGLDNGVGGGQTAIIASLDADGFTLTWTKAGAGTTNDLNLVFVGIR